MLRGLDEIYKVLQENEVKETKKDEIDFTDLNNKVSEIYDKLLKVEAEKALEEIIENKGDIENG